MRIFEPGAVQGEFAGGNALPNPRESLQVRERHFDDFVLAAFLALFLGRRTQSQDPGLGGDGHPRRNEFVTATRRSLEESAHSAAQAMAQHDQILNFEHFDAEFQSRAALVPW